MRYICMDDNSEHLDASTPTSSESIAQMLKSRILAGSYDFGQRLIEMDLAKEFSVGRGRIREAFRTLVGEGYLEFVANRGVLVRRYSREELLAMGRAREVLEGLAARLAAESKLSEENREVLSSLQQRLNHAEATQDLLGFARENRAYHRLIEQLAGNDHVTDFIERVRIPVVRLQLPPSFAADSMERSNRDHRTITVAILSGSPDAAEAAMRAHVRAGNDHIASLPDEVFES
jgi:DNA-binding GntR family transcriptional regulator